MPNVILSETRQRIQVVPDGYSLDGETVRTPGGSSWTVPGAVSAEPISAAQAQALAARETDYHAAMEAHGRRQLARQVLADAGLAHLLPDDEPPPERPAVYLTPKGNPSVNPQPAKAAI
jgi:hypothetical protein